MLFYHLDLLLYMIIANNILKIGKILEMKIKCEIYLIMKKTYHLNRPDD